MLSIFRKDIYSDHNTIYCLSTFMAGINWWNDSIVAALEFNNSVKLWSNYDVTGRKLYERVLYIFDPNVISC